MVPSGTRTVLREAAGSGRADGVNKTLTKMRKGRGTKVPLGQAHKSPMESTSLSVVDQVRFLEGLERNDSNPLHSTALEEHLDVQEEGQLDKNRGQRGKIAPVEKQGAPVEKQGAAAKRKGSGGGEEEERKKKSRIDRGGKGRARQQKGAAERQPDEEAERSKTTRSTATISRGLSGKKPVGMRKAPGRTPAGRLAQRQQLEEESETASESADEKTLESEEESDSDGARRNRRRLPSSDEEDDEGSVWNPSPVTTKRLTQRLSLGRKSSSDKTKDAKAGVGQKKLAGRGGSQLEVVLDAVLDFIQQYGETVESAAVRESVCCFANNVKTHLEEQISSLKDLGSLKRQNIKVGSLIRTKTQRLLNAKHELMRAERQLCLLEKEKAELQQRLDDLRRGRAFLHNVRELTARYLAHRRKHPAEKETFGASSLAALWLETKLTQRPAHPPSEAKKMAKK